MSPNRKLSSHKFELMAIEVLVFFFLKIIINQYRERLVEYVLLKSLFRKFFTLYHPDEG